MFKETLSSMPIEKIKEMLSNPDVVKRLTKQMLEMIENELSNPNRRLEQ
jgi:hypothetical protein